MIKKKRWNYIYALSGDTIFYDTKVCIFPLSNAVSIAFLLTTLAPGLKKFLCKIDEFNLLNC